MNNEEHPKNRSKDAGNLHLFRLDFNQVLDVPSYIVSSTIF